MRNFFESISLSGGIITLFAFFIFCGIVMEACGNPAGKDVRSTFATALTTFVSAKKVAEMEFKNKDDQK